MTPHVVRGIFHGALSIYMDRFLNVPPARVPTDKEVQDLPTGAGELRTYLLSQFDHHANVEGAARAVARYLRLGHPVEKLIDTLTLATVREDLDFHAIQVLEAGVRQCELWREQPQIETIFIGVARQLAAFCPTPRAAHQLATVGSRLERGEKIYDNSMN